MNKFIIFYILAATMILSGCAPSAPVQITELSEIVGLWKTDPPFGVFQIASDGTTKSAVTVTGLNAGDYHVSSFSFENGIFIVRGFVCRDDQPGSYEVNMLPSGNLEFSLLSDECSDRPNIFIGQSVEPVIHVEWVRVE